jgi:hypothetical protein
MTDRPHVLTDDDGRRRKGIGPLPLSSLSDLAPLLIAAGTVLAVAGWVDVALFYYPSQFSSPEWEFGTIAQTFDAMPLPTLGLLLIALGIRARGGSVLWSRSMAVVLAIVALLCIAALLLFAMDVPLALKAMKSAGGQADPQQAALISSGLKRGMAKVILFSVCYATAFAWMAVIMWRVRREPT